MTEEMTLPKSKLRAKRLRAIRQAVGLSRQEFADQVGVKKSSIKNWEDAFYSGLTIKGANVLIDGLKNNLYVHISLSWLMEGIGEPPIFPESILNSIQNGIDLNKLTEEEIIQQELLTFYKFNKSAIDMIIKDNDLAPMYKEGDYIAGSRLFGVDTKKAIGEDCIVETLDRKILIRNVHFGSKVGKFNLTKINSMQISHENIDLFSAAPIIFIRRHSRIKNKT